MDRRGIVLSKAGGRYRVFVDGTTHEVSIRGRLKQGADQVLVGDWVVIREHAELYMALAVPRRPCEIKLRETVYLRTGAER